MRVSARSARRDGRHAVRGGAGGRGVDARPPRPGDDALPDGISTAHRLSSHLHSLATHARTLSIQIVVLLNQRFRAVILRVTVT